MTKRLRRYPEELQRHMIDLVRSGRTPEELSREFDPSAQTIRNWVAAAESEDGASGDWSEGERRSFARPRPRSGGSKRKSTSSRRRRCGSRGRPAGETLVDRDGPGGVPGGVARDWSWVWRQLGLVGIVASESQTQGGGRDRAPRTHAGPEAAGGRGSRGARKRSGRQAGAFPVGDRAGLDPEERMWRRDRRHAAAGEGCRGAFRELGPKVTGFEA